MCRKLYIYVGTHMLCINAYNIRIYKVLPSVYTSGSLNIYYLAKYIYTANDLSGFSLYNYMLFPTCGHDIKLIIYLLLYLFLDTCGASINSVLSINTCTNAVKYIDCPSYMSHCIK